MSPGTVEAAGMFDVLEHIEDEAGALQRVHQLLRPGGRLGLQAICLDAVGHAGSRAGKGPFTDLILERIFPESMSASLSELVLGWETDFELEEFHAHPEHYRKTFRAWALAHRRQEALARKLVGEETRRGAPDPVDWRWVEVDRVRVKGKNRPVTLFTPVVVALDRSALFEEETRLWELALASYRLQDWGDTHARLQGLLEGFAESGLAGLYRQLAERTHHHRTTPPPEGWDGAHTFDSK